MALRILQFSVLFAVGYSVERNRNSGFTGGVIPPDIALSLTVTDPQDVIVQRGQSALFSCQAKSTKGDVEITWYHNDEKIPSNTTKWRKQQDGSLYIPKVPNGKRGVLGDYRCLVRNKAGAILSNVAKLKIASMEREFSTNPSNITIIETQLGVLQCGIHSTPPAHIQWEFNSNLILPQQTRYVPLPNGVLLIKKTQISDSGTYRCKATNRILNKVIYSKIAVMTVLSEMNKTLAPVFLPLHNLSNNTFNLDEQMILYCAVMGWPTPTIQWFKDDDIMIGNSSIFKISEVQEYHSGSYTCSASNILGHISQKYYVNVHQKPFFRYTPVSKSYPSSITVRLDCGAGGLPTPNISWLIDGQPLKLDFRVKMQDDGLVIGQTFSQDSGIYQCVASNSVGTIWSAVEVRINVSRIVNPPYDLECRSYDSSSICLNWKTSLNTTIQGYSIHSFYKDGESEVGGPDYFMKDKTYINADGLKSHINYTFYVRVYSFAASDPSENITCKTGVTGSRNLDIEQFGVDSVKLKWSEISTDVSCEGKRFPYEVQWRRDIPYSSDSDETSELTYTVKGLFPGIKYGFRVVSTMKPENSPWVEYTFRGAIQDDFENNSKGIDTTPVPPEQIRSSIVSPFSVKLKWTNSEKNSKYFVVCYVPIFDGSSCENGTYLNSESNELQVKKLKPDTKYEFRVRTHNLKGIPGPFSESVIVHTPADVPSAVSDLSYNVVNESAAYLHWKAPTYKGSKILEYIISYTPDINWALESWINISIPAKGEDNVSMLLVNLSSNAIYSVLVRAVSELGIGRHTFPLLVTTKIVTEPPYKADSSSYHQKVGVGVGTILSVFIIIGCLSCILIRRRCIKQRAIVRARMEASNNYCPPVAHYTPRVNSVQVILQNPPIPDTQENQHIVSEGITANIPPISAVNLDTKYSAIERKNQVAEKSKYTPLKHLQEDSNSNINSSKFYDLQRLFENSKKSKSSNYHQCNPHFDQNGYELCSSCEDVNSCESSWDNSLDATQMTSLNYSDIPIMGNNRRKSLISGPNG
ncbi:protogenin isoform X2 [Leptinotarsa decemlineata]|uniref:protogenin isoform X2 n=1 Tax=Leptinotarsa decemlineata TaxID=7539 RepID=UPI003D3065BF